MVIKKYVACIRFISRSTEMQKDEEGIKKTRICTYQCAINFLLGS